MANYKERAAVFVADARGNRPPSVHHVSGADELKEIIRLAGDKWQDNPGFDWPSNPRLEVYGLAHKSLVIGEPGLM